MAGLSSSIEKSRSSMPYSEIIEFTEYGCGQCDEQRIVLCPDLKVGILVEGNSSTMI
jgi:hypothetical protein